MKEQKLSGKVLMGNEAMAWGIIESGASMATSYPGTPASEILETVEHIKKTYQVPIK